MSFMRDMERAAVRYLQRVAETSIGLAGNLMFVKILRAASWLIILGLVIVTVVPADERPVTGLQHDLEHFLAFGLAGATFALAYTWRLHVKLWSAVIFALVLELSQIPLATRHARFEDFVVDAAAACLGIVLVHGSRKLIGTWSVRPAEGL
jgi:VanZ family protein